MHYGTLIRVDYFYENLIHWNACHLSVLPRHLKVDLFSALLHHLLRLLFLCNNNNTFGESAALKLKKSSTTFGVGWGQKIKLILVFEFIMRNYNHKFFSKYFFHFRASLHSLLNNNTMSMGFKVARHTQSGSNDWLTHSL